MFRVSQQYAHFLHSLAIKVFQDVHMLDDIFYLTLALKKLHLACETNGIGHWFSFFNIGELKFTNSLSLIKDVLLDTSVS